MKKSAKLVSGLNTKLEMWMGDSVALGYDTNTPDGFKMWSSKFMALSKTGLDYIRKGAAAGSLECQRLVEIGERLGLVDFSKFNLPGVLFGKPLAQALRPELEDAMEKRFRRFGLNGVIMDSRMRRQMMQEVVQANLGKYAELLENEWIGAPWLRWTPGANAAHELEGAAAKRMLAYCKDVGDLMSSLPKARAEAKAAGVDIPLWSLKGQSVGYTELAFKRLEKMEVFYAEPVAVLAGVKSKALYAEKVGADGGREELGFYNKRAEFSADPSDAALFESHGAAMSATRHLWRKHGNVVVAVVDVRMSVVGCQSAMSPAVSHDRLMAAIAQREREEMLEYAKKIDAERLVERVAQLQSQNKELRERLGMEPESEVQKTEVKKRRL